MAQVTVAVTPYPGSTEGIEFEEFAAYGVGWVSASSSAGPGITHVVTVTSAKHDLRARWEIDPGVFTEWFGVSGVERKTPTAEQAAQLKQALIAKATREYVMSGAPLGYTGEMGEFGMATVKPDYTIREMLHGLRFIDWDIDYSALVTVDEVIRVGFSSEPTEDAWTAQAQAQLGEAIEAAVHWITTEIFEGLAFA